VSGPILDPHPLVASEAALAEGAKVPGPAGVRAPTGRLSERTLEMTMAIAEALFSSDDQKPPPEDRMAFLRREYADFMSRATPKGRLLFWAAPRAISLLAPLLSSKRPPLARLTIEERVKVLSRFEASPFAGVLIALRALLCMIYYEHPAAANAAGVPKRGRA